MNESNKSLTVQFPLEEAEELIQEIELLDVDSRVVPRRSFQLLKFACAEISRLREGIEMWKSIADILLKQKEISDKHREIQQKLGFRRVVSHLRKEALDE